MTKIYLDRNVEDVNITTPADTELLVWDEATQQWVNAGMTIIPGSNITVDDTDPLNPIVGLVTTISGIDYLQFDTSYSDGVTEGRLQWNTADGTLEVGLPGGNVNLQIGQENLIKATNKTGATIVNGSVVFVNGAQGHRPTISGAIASVNLIANATLGVATEDIAHDHFGYVSTLGLVRDVNTSAFTEGAILYLSDTTPGALTMTAPSAPNTVVGVAVCLYKHATEGILGVFPRILSVLASRSILNDAGGYYTGADVETALQEVGVDLDKQEAHINDSTIHYPQTSITNLSSSLNTGLVKLTTGTGALSTITDNSANWDTAYGWGDHASAGYLTSGTVLDHNSLPGLQGGQIGEYYHLNKTRIDDLTGGATVDATSQHNHSFSTLLDVENPTTSDNFFYWDNVNKIVKNVSIKEYLNIHDLSDVRITGGAASGQVLTLNSTMGWHNEDLPTASTTAKGIVELATSAETTAGLAVQASDTRLSDSRTPMAHTHGGGDITSAVANATEADTLDGNHASAFAVAAKGVTNGDSHDHKDGDGAQINHTTLSNIGTNTHAQIDTFISSKAAANGLASLSAGSLVVQNPANATATATANKIPIANGSGKLDTWVSDASTTAKGIVELATDGEKAANVAVQGNDSRINDGIWTFLTTPLTSTSWDGDARSTTAATKIDLSSVFSGYPTSAVKAVLVRLQAKDSASLGATGLSVSIGPSATYFYAVSSIAIGGDVATSQTAICPCDANGDIYYRIVSSGTGTMDVRLEIWGYCV